MKHLPSEEGLIDIKAASELTQFSEKALELLVYLGMLPCVRTGMDAENMYFEPDEVVRVTDAGKRAIRARI